MRTPSPSWISPPARPAALVGGLLLLLAACDSGGAPTAVPPRVGPSITIRADAQPSHPVHLELGLAQGAESPDPAFLRPTVPLIKDLGIKFVRVDNVYNYTNTITTRSDVLGLAYDWTPLDTVVDSIRDMGAEPLLDLSYMPTALNSQSRLLPPADWAEWSKLVSATVRHMNTDRNLNLRYWEVWNEPNQLGFWKGSFPEYLQLYDSSRRAIRGRQPLAKVGGPALSLYDESALDWMLGYENSQDDGGAVGFLSWHAYGWSPAELADQVQKARALIARKGSKAGPPELLITELGVRTGGPGDTSADNRADTPAAAAYLIASIQALEGAGLDKLFVFELRDGPHEGGQFWGRWGILTHDLHPKPIYHVLKAYKALGPTWLPTTVSPARADVGLLAAPNGRGILWHTGSEPVHVSVNWAGARNSQVTLFDADHNNPAANKGGDKPTPQGRLDPGSWTFDLQPDSVVLFEP
jgi:hypothetical protein